MNKIAFEADGSRIAFRPELMDELARRLKGTSTRMTKILGLNSTKVEGKAHNLIKKSDSSMLLACSILEEEVSKQKLQHRPAIKFLKAKIVAALNTIDSVEDALAEGAIKVRELHEAASEVKSTVDAAFSQLTAFLVEEEKVEALFKSNEQKASLLSEDGEIKEGREVKASNVRYERDLQKAIQLLHLSKSSKPKSIEGKPFHILDIPVIPIFNMMLDADQLMKGGVEVAATVGSYVSLAHQMVVAVDLDNLQLPEVKAKKKKWTPTSYVKEIAAVISQKKGHEYFLVSSLPAHRPVNDGFLYYWLSSDSSWSRLHKAVVKSESGKSKGLILESWGIPF